MGNEGAELWFSIRSEFSGNPLMGGPHYPKINCAVKGTPLEVVSKISFYWFILINEIKMRKIRNYYMQKNLDYICYFEVILKTKKIKCGSPRLNFPYKIIWLRNISFISYSTLHSRIRKRVNFEKKILKFSSVFQRVPFSICLCFIFHLFIKV